MSGVVEDADGLGILVIARDDALDLVAGAAMIPDVGVEEFLERSRSDVVEERDRLDALTRQTAELAANVSPQMLPRLGPTEAIIELGEKLTEFGPQREDLIDSHP
jgi:hypothetical protein